MKQPNHNLEYAQMGMAALLPGMVHMLELMQRQVDDFRARLTGLQEQAATEQEKPAGRRKSGRPVSAAGRSGWPEDPAERKLEMQRRMAKWRKPKESALSVKRKKDWAALSPAKRKKRLAAMLAGRKVNKAKQVPVVQLEQAS